MSASCSGVTRTSRRWRRDDFTARSLMGDRLAPSGRCPDILVTILPPSTKLRTPTPADGKGTRLRLDHGVHGVPAASERPFDTPLRRVDHVDLARAEVGDEEPI